MDLKIRLFRQDIINYINSVDLPMEVKRLVFAEIYSQITNETENLLKIQLEKQKKGELENESGKELHEDKLGELSE